MMKRTYILILLMLSALCVHAQYLEPNPYKRYTSNFSTERIVYKLNGADLIAAVQANNYDEAEKILKRMPFLANASLMVYPKNKVARPLMCELISQGKVKIVNLFFMHGFHTNHVCPDGKKKTNVMKMLERSSNSNMYCYLIKKGYPVLLNRLVKHIKEGSTDTLNLPCLDELMDKEKDIRLAVYDTAKTGNSTAIKLAVKHLDKIQSSVASIGADVVVNEYVKTGDRSLIDPFYDKSLFTSAQWNTITTEARRKNSFARQVLPLLLAVIKADKGFEYQMKQIDDKYKKWAQGTNPTSADKNIYGILHDVFSDATTRSPSTNWLNSFGTDAPPELIKKYYGNETKGEAYYFSSGVTIVVGTNHTCDGKWAELDSKKFTKPVVIVLKRVWHELEPVYEYRWVENHRRDETYAPSGHYIEMRTNPEGYHTTNVKVYDIDDKEIYTAGPYRSENVSLRDSRENFFRTWWR